MDIEKEIQTLDFSKFSKIKDSLYQTLLRKREMKRELDFEELDYTAAAGVNHIPKNNDKTE